MQLTDRLHAFLWESMTTNNCNTYLIDGPARILIDPGHEHLFDHVRSGLDRLDLSVDDIGLVICTHGHPDHIEAMPLFVETPALITINPTEWQLLKGMQKQMGLSLGRPFERVVPDFFLQEGDFSLNGIDMQVFNTPGHSPGSISLYWKAEKALFTGDLIFNEGVGRTDLPGGNGADLKDSIRRLQALEVDWLLSGHGGVVQGADAVRRNFEQVVDFWFRYI